MGAKERTLLSQALAWTDSLQGQSGQRTALDISGPCTWGGAKAGYTVCFVLLPVLTGPERGPEPPLHPAPTLRLPLTQPVYTSANLHILG